MAKRGGKYRTHDFYCMYCGNKSIPLMRKNGHQHERFHRKRMYCPICGQEVNHIECKTLEDVYEFKMNFQKGVYKNEAEESLAVVRGSRLWENDLCSKTTV